MSRRKKWALRVLVGLTLLLGAAWFSAPSLVRWQVNKKPGVHVESVEIRFKQKCLVLHGVTADRGWVKGQFPSATVCEDKTVTIESGEVQADLDLKKESSGSSDGYKVTANHLKVHVTKGDLKADLTETSVNDTEVCSETATVTHPKGEVTARGLCVKRNGEEVRFTDGTVKPLVKLFDRDLGTISVGATTVDLKGHSVFTASLSVDKVTATKVTASLKEGLASGSAETLRFKDERLHTEPLTFSKVEMGPLDPTKALDGDQAIKISGVTLHFNVKERHIWGSETCQAWFLSVPEELRTGPLQGLTFTGDFKFDLKLKPEVKLDWTLTCKHPKPAPAFITILTKQFEYVAYDGKGQEFTRKTGVNTKGWTPLQNINPNIVTALTTTEDPGFFQHKGFIRQAVENSIIDNLKAGKALRGASTITMQLAKNLWLRRTKTLGRKVQEAFLTIVLESHLSKDQILELYLNVVEFGPDLYGIGPASKELLGTDPMNLSLVDSLYLVLRLPSPKKAGPLDEHKKAQIKKLLQMMAASGKVPEDVAAVEMTLITGGVPDPGPGDP